MLGKILGSMLGAIIGYIFVTLIITLITGAVGAYVNETAGTVLIILLVAWILLGPIVMWRAAKEDIQKAKGDIRKAKEENRASVRSVLNHVGYLVDQQAPVDEAKAYIYENYGKGTLFKTLTEEQENEVYAYICKNVSLLGFLPEFDFKSRERFVTEYRRRQELWCLWWNVPFREIPPLSEEMRAQAFDEAAMRYWRKHWEPSTGAGQQFSGASDRSRNIKENLFLEQLGKCNGCQRTMGYENLTLDHIIPTSLGGRDDDDNLQLLCGYCNSKKGNRPMKWLLDRLKEEGKIT